MRTGARRRPWTEGNLEGQKRVTSHKCKRVSAGPLVVTSWQPAGTSPRMLSEPTIAIYEEVEGYATDMCVLLRVSAVIVKSVGSVKFPIKAQRSSQQVQFQTSREERKVDGVDELKSALIEDEQYTREILCK